jgi:hypothetical protein
MGASLSVEDSLDDASSEEESEASDDDVLESSSDDEASVAVLVEEDSVLVEGSGVSVVLDESGSLEVALVLDESSTLVAVEVEVESLPPVSLGVVSFGQAASRPGSTPRTT